MRDSLRSVRTAALEGFGFGALLYGSVIAFLHVLLNRLDGVGDGVVTFLVLAMIYGLWAAVLFGGTAVLAQVFRGLFGASYPPDEATPAFLPGILLFNIFFWELHYLYGLTYGQVPGMEHRGPWAMTGVLVAFGLAVALGAVVASWLVARLWRGLAQRGTLRWTALASAVTGVLACGLAPLFLGAAGSSGDVSTPPRIEVRDTGVSVVFVGLDGADWQVARPLMEAGELPAFQAIEEQGATASLGSIPDANSAVIWATIFSGATRQQHRVEDFYRIEIPGLGGEGLFPVHRTFFQELAGFLEPTGLLRRTLVTRYSHHALPWWEVADHAGLSIGVVDGYLTSFPAYSPKTDGSYFVSYGSDSFAKSLAQRGPKDVELFLQPPELFRGLRDSLEAGPDFVWQSATLGQLLEEEGEPRLVTFYTHEPDTAQHKFWKWYEPERYFGSGGRDGAAAAATREAIPKIYRDFDAFLAKLRVAVGPEAVIVVASDHGHSPTLVHKLYTQHRHGPPGILLMDGGPVRPGLKLADADVYDIFPTILHLLGLPVPEDQPGRVLEEALDPQFLARFPVRKIPSYAFLDPGASAATALDPERNRQELEKLKSLGYI